MLKLKCYWAGQLVHTRSVEDPMLAASLCAITLALKNGRLTHVMVGTTFLIGELCIDVYKEDVLCKMFQVKK